MLKCKAIKKKMSLYIDNQLSEKEMMYFKKHIDTCAECRVELEELEALVSDLNSLSRYELPEGYKNSLHNKLVEAQYDTNSNINTIPWYLNWKLYSSLVAGILLIFAFKNQVYDPIYETDKAYVSDIQLQERNYETFSKTKIYGFGSDGQKTTEEAVEEEINTDEDPVKITTRQTSDNNNTDEQKAIEQNARLQKEVNEDVSDKSTQVNNMQNADKDDGIQENIVEETPKTETASLAENDQPISLQQQVPVAQQNSAEINEKDISPETVASGKVAMFSAPQDSVIDNFDAKNEDRIAAGAPMYRGRSPERSIPDDNYDLETINYVFVEISHDDKDKFTKEYPDITERYKDKYLMHSNNKLIISLTQEEYTYLKTLADMIDIAPEEKVEVKDVNILREELKTKQGDLYDNILEYIKH